MIDAKTQFDHRLRDLGRKHAAMANGYTPKVRADGLIVIQPKRKNAFMPFKFAMFAIAALLMFKTFLLAAVGPDAYSDRLGKLETGTVFEQAGAWAMQIDPATQYAAGMIGPILR